MAVTSKSPQPVTDADFKAAVESTETPKTNGTPLSALLAAGIGVLVLGLNTTLADAAAGFKSAMVIDAFKPVGPLAGKTTYAVVAYGVAWAVSYFVMRGKNYTPRPFFIATFVLIALGFLLTFPPGFEFFADLFKKK